MQKRKWPTLTEERDRAVRAYLERTLRHTRGNVAHAARLAGRNRTDMYKLLRRYDLMSAQPRPRQHRGRWAEFGL